MNPTNKIIARARHSGFLLLIKIMKSKSLIFSEKIIIGLLIFVLLFNLFPFHVYAVWYNPLTWGEDLSDVANAFINFPAMVLSEIGKWINYGLANFLYIFLWLASWFLSLAGLLFDWALKFNLDTATFDPNSFGGFVKEGWRYVRDTVNLLFIFILLIIAIATIIGWETYGIKKALPTFIIIILLINFSLLFSRYVIEFSNSLGNYVYTEKTFQSIEFLKKEGRIGENVEVSIAGMVLEGISPQKIYDLRLKEGADFFTTTRDIIAGSILGIIIMAVAAITFFTAAIMLFLRVATLWFVMILAPAALFLWALPATEGYAKDWLMILIRQSIFLPVLVFLLSLAVYLSIHINEVSFADTTLDFSQASLSPKIDVLKPESFLSFIARYIVIIIAFGAALAFARSLAEKGTGAIYSYASKGKDMASGYAMAGGGWAGVKALQGASYWPRYGASRGWEALKGRITRPPKLDEEGKLKKDETGKAIDKGGILERFGRTKVGGLIPGYRGFMQEARVGVQENIDEYKKNLNRLGNYDLKQKHNIALTVPQERVAIEEILAERKDMSGLNSAYIKDAIKVAEKAGRSSGAIERLGYQWGGIIEEGPQKGKLSDESRKGFEKMRPQNIRDIIEEGGDAYTMFIEKIKALDKTTGIAINDLSSLAKAFRAVGNKATAIWLENKQAEDLMKDLFGRVKGGPGTQKTGGGGEHDVDEEEFKKR